MVKFLKDYLKKSSKDKLSFFEFMKLALYAPRYGYYASSAEKFGSHGDFITAPELTPLFAQGMAVQFAQIFQHLPQKNILELGAGSGKFAMDVLQALESKGVEIDHYYILEVSEDLRERQKAYCKKFDRFFPKMIWLDTLPPSNSWTGIVFGNEVLDAMPVHRFIKRDGKIWEESVELKGVNFSYGEPLEPSSELLMAVQILEERLGAFAEGYCSEVNLWIRPWLRSLYDSLKAGAVLLIDYGYSEREYYASSRKAGTLMSYFQHQAHSDVLFQPGDQDITAHVNFSEVAEAGIEAGFELSGYTTQGLFLAKVLQEIGPLEPSVSQHLRRLMHPEAMGEIFKVIGFEKNLDFDGLEFDGVNQMHQL